MEQDPKSVVLQNFRLYETRSRYYLVGRDKAKLHWRILKIDRSEPSELVVVDDPLVYTDQELKRLLQQLALGNRSSGGLQFVTKAYGIVGFVKFLEPWYMILVTKRRILGSICGHAVYGVDESQLITIPHSSIQLDIANSKTELRYKKLLSGVDLTKDFYFSYTYPIMHTLQRNAAQRQPSYLWQTLETGYGFNSDLYESMFVWNSYLTRGIRQMLSNTQWTIALCHGFFQQAKMSLFGRVFVITLIARRSRHFAGTRYLKRGVNDSGRVANEVETEQIVVDEGSGAGAIPPQMTSVVQIRGSIPLYWSQEASRLSAKPDIQLHKFDPMYTSTQLHFEDLEDRYGNPVIILNLIKTFEKRPREMILRREFGKAATYLNLVRPSEKQIIFIHWDYHKFSKGKTAAANVLSVLGGVASECLELTGMFYTGKPSITAKKWARIQHATSAAHTMEQQQQQQLGPGSVSWDPLDLDPEPSSPPLASLLKPSSHSLPPAPFSPLSPLPSAQISGPDPTSAPISRSASLGAPSPPPAGGGGFGQSQPFVVWPSAYESDPGRAPTFQAGVLRTNCIDCLDRTNVAQYAFGLEAMGRQLYALGLSDETKLDSESGVTSVLMSLYESMGDVLALQYGGSAAHNTVFPEKQGKWRASTKSRELFLSIRRYYSNAYTDAEKQDAINLFLGHFQPHEDKPALWDLLSSSNQFLSGVDSPEPSPRYNVMRSHTGHADRPIRDFQSFPPPLANLSLPLADDPKPSMKLTSFDKLTSAGEGHLRNVRLFPDSDRSPRHRSAKTAEMKFGLDSPEWLFGQHRRKKVDSTSGGVLDKGSRDSDLARRYFPGRRVPFNFEGVVAITATADEVAFYKRYLAQTSADNDWYGTGLFHGFVEDSHANLFYEHMCKRVIPITIESSLQDDATLDGDCNYFNRDMEVEEVMRTSLEMQEAICADFGSVFS